MQRISPTDRQRVEFALAEMYRAPDERCAHLVERSAESLGCCRRQVERAFAGFRTGAGRQLREIRLDLASACLVHPRLGRQGFTILAKRVGMTDDRALRDKVNARWKLSPREIRDAAALDRYVKAMDRSHEETVRNNRPYPRDRRYRDELDLRRRRSLRNVPVETKRLIDGSLELPTPMEAAHRSRELAQARVAELDRQLALEEVELAA